jgi:DNA-binding response OmpR family regulator
MKILVIDDEPDVREMLERVISRGGYQALAAGSGLEGLMSAQREGPELILLDIMMHPMDGWETLRLLKLDPKTREIPVVIVSARAEPKDKIRALQEGAADYVTKPFALREVREKIESLLARGGE